MLVGGGGLREQQVSITAESLSSVLATGSTTKAQDSAFGMITSSLANPESFFKPLNHTDL